MVKIWCFSFGVVLVCLLVYYILSKITWLDNLGRATRSRKNEKLENFLTDLQRLTIVHESSGDGGGGFYRFASGAATSKEEDTDEKKDDKKDKKKDKKPKDKDAKDKDAKDKDTKDKKDADGKSKPGDDGAHKGKDVGHKGGAAAEGDKAMGDQAGNTREQEDKKKQERYEDVGSEHYDRQGVQHPRERGDAPSQQPERYQSQVQQPPAAVTRPSAHGDYYSSGNGEQYASANQPQAQNTYNRQGEVFSTELGPVIYDSENSGHSSDYTRVERSSHSQDRPY